MSAFTLRAGMPDGTGKTGSFRLDLLLENRHQQNSTINEIGEREINMPHRAYKYETTVGEGGKLELSVPIPSGTHVEVLVLTPEADDQLEDLVGAAASSMEFWDNPWDDEDWNNA